MVNTLLNEDAVCRDPLSVAIRIIANIQGALLELEHSLLTRNALQSNSVICHSAPVSSSMLDCSAYFEPIIDPTLFTSEWTESAECGAPDFSDYFEPVAPCQHGQGMLQ